MKISTDNGVKYWRSLDQLAETPEFKKILDNEFPENPPGIAGGALSRRKFLALMGASIAFAGLAGCQRPVEKIVPYVKAPENITPGNSLFYASAMPFGLSAYGIVVESRVGRPTKIEGNINHRLTKGKSGALIQASILNLYDPDRSGALRNKAQEASWSEFVSFYQELQKTFIESQGRGLAILSSSFASPTLFRLYEEFTAAFPEAQWAVYEPVSDENIYDGIKAISGQNIYPVYDYSKADIVVSLDSDFLYAESDEISAVRGFAEARSLKTENDTMNRLYVVENMYSTTGAMSDHRLRLPSSHVAPFALEIAKELRNQGLEIPIPNVRLDGFDRDAHQKWIQAIAKDLKKHKGKSLIVAGKRQPPYLHALAAVMNHGLGNTNNSVRYVSLKDALPPSLSSLNRLVESIDNGKIQTLIIMDGNPVYNALVDMDFAAKLAKVKNTVHFSSHVDETSRQTTWHIPAAHYLESWGDVRSNDGVRSVVQPLIEPLFNGVMRAQLLNLIVTGKDENAHDIVRKTWKSIFPELDFEKKWRKTLNSGVCEENLYESEEVGFNSENLGNLSKSLNIENLSKDALEITFAADASVFDGRYANNGWLQETPDPISKLAWDNPALISLNTAKELGLKNEDMVSLTCRGRSLELPVWIMPGQADNTIAVSLGYGRTSAGRVGNNVGFNAYLLRQTSAKDFAHGAAVKATGKRYKLANTQNHGSMEGRALVREAPLTEYQSHPHFAAEMVEHPPLESLWKEHPYDEGNQWGMTIDLNACTGCNACMIACQSENNIPIVGKEQVSKGREMSWIRLDRYFSGDLQNPEMVYQPVTCVHCEMAPCEQVCPVAATVHDEEGLNVMVYNRCIGTRYCANNCPYKVRRFNFFNFTKDYPHVFQMAQNPDVSVRSRGVMEKCTFCTQRINQAKVKAKKEGRELADSEILTACQQSCPADAIRFGNMLDKNSNVSKSKMNNRNYAMLGELNLKPRITYLAKIRNPNPDLADTKSQI